ncbi:MAG: DUF1294 domain-containing protein [Atopobiaceae bacterium]|nr:DUF1294 domain-containing protein [Atopobiaceae bacterium]
MHPLLLYLVAINVVTFLAFVVDFLLCRWRPEIDDTTANSLVMDVFPIVGGAAGMLLALLLLTGLMGGHRMTKNNVAWWFLAIVCLVVWTLVAMSVLGIVRPNASLGAVVSGWNVGRLKILGVYLALVNALTFAVFAWDKHVAANGNDRRRRVPEARLLGLGIIGGSLGGLLAMHAVRHKTQKWYFAWGLPCFIALHAVVLLYVHMVGVV